eukprot:1598273-Prymnesium_polylepis.1
MAYGKRRDVCVACDRSRAQDGILDHMAIQLPDKGPAKQPLSGAKRAAPPPVAPAPKRKPTPMPPPGAGASGSQP